jgi:hypothetical protein
MIRNKAGAGAPNVICRFLFFFAQGLIAIQLFIANMLAGPYTGWFCPL